MARPAWQYRGRPIAQRLRQDGNRHPGRRRGTPAVRRPRRRGRPRHAGPRSARTQASRPRPRQPWQRPRAAGAAGRSAAHCSRVRRIGWLRRDPPAAGSGASVVAGLGRRFRCCHGSRALAIRSAARRPRSGDSGRLGRDRATRPGTSFRRQPAHWQRFLPRHRLHQHEREPGHRGGGGQRLPAGPPRDCGRRLAARAPAGAPAARAAARIAASTRAGGSSTRRGCATPRRRRIRRRAASRRRLFAHCSVLQRGAQPAIRIAQPALDGLDRHAGERRDLAERQSRLDVQQECVALCRGHGRERIAPAAAGLRVDRLRERIRARSPRLPSSGRPVGRRRRSSSSSDANVAPRRARQWSTSRWRASVYSHVVKRASAA